MNTDKQPKSTPPLAF